MATQIRTFTFLSLFLFVLVPLHGSLTTIAPISDGISFDAIYQFGDSLSDTGNVMWIDPSDFPCANFPYGESFFPRPTGRCSNGLLMADFIANAFGLPFLKPYLDPNASFSNGVNFAVAGATALDAAVLDAFNITTYNYSLPVELNWLRTHLQSVCSSGRDCKANLQKTLFLLGEIGGNDINFAFLDGKSFDFVYSLIPEVTKEIKEGVEAIIAEGATYIVVPGNFPIGCIPLYHTTYASNDTSDYDDMKCLKAYNEVAQSQNSQLQQAIAELQEQYPEVFIAYGDYYNAYLWMLENAASLGLDEDQVFSPCCGTLDITCGNEGAPLCENPKTRVNWDGAHPTHEAYRHMSNWLLSHIFKKVSSY